MPSIHSVAQTQHRKQEKLEIIERKFKEILKRIIEINQLIRILKHVIMNLQVLCHKWKIGLIFLFY